MSAQRSEAGAGGAWDVVYDLHDDAEHIAAVQQATLKTRDFGLEPEPALFGSSEWWQGIADGRLPARVAAGVISSMTWESMGDWPVFELAGDDGTTTRWTCYGDATRYVQGLRARVTYVEQRAKRGSRLPVPTMHQVVIRVELEPSDRRSARGAPGPARTSV